MNVGLVLHLGRQRHNLLAGWLVADLLRQQLRQRKGHEHVIGIVSPKLLEAIDRIPPPLLVLVSLRQSQQHEGPSSTRV